MEGGGGRRRREEEEGGREEGGGGREEGGERVKGGGKGGRDRESEAVAITQHTSAANNPAEICRKQSFRNHCNNTHVCLHSNSTTRHQTYHVHKNYYT